MPKEASLLDAINAAIPSGEADVPETEEEIETPEGEEIETPEGEEAETPEGEEEETPEGEEEAEGEETPDEAAAAAAKKPADPINDPLPKGTLQSTSERFKHVVDTLKKQTERADTSEKQYDELIGHITGAGMGGKEFSTMLDYAAGVNGGTYDGLVKSRSILLRELETVSKMLGDPMPGEDILVNHPDLLKEVNDKLITPQRATEIAKQRNQNAAQTRLNQVGQNRQQTTQQAQQEAANGQAALTKLGQELAKKDGQPEYVRKARLVVAQFEAEKLMDGVPPKQWAALFRSAYALIPSKAAPKPAAGGKNQPLRGNKAPAAAGSMAKQPKNLREAIDGAFQS